MSGPIRGQYPGHVISLDQSEASIQVVVGHLRLLEAAPGVAWRKPDVLIPKPGRGNLQDSVHHRFATSTDDL